MRSGAPVSPSVSAKEFLYPVMPRAEVRHWVMNRTQPATLESKGSWGMVEGERERDSPRKAEQILTLKYAGQINGVNKPRCMKLGPAHKDWQLSCFHTAIFYLDAF